MWQVDGRDDATSELSIRLEPLPGNRWALRALGKDETVAVRRPYVGDPSLRTVLPFENSLV